MKEKIDLSQWIKNLKEQEKRYKNATDLKDENGALMSMVLLVVALHEELDERLMIRIRADKDLQRRLETGNMPNIIVEDYRPGMPPPNPLPKTAKIYQFKLKENVVKP